MTATIGGRLVTRLSSWELRMGAILAALRCADDFVEQKQAYFDRDASLWSANAVGILGEMAFARILGIYWVPPPRDQRHDVAGWQVRTASRASGSLFVKGHEPGEDRFVLMTGFRDIFTLVGWTTGAEARRVGNPITERDEEGKKLAPGELPKVAVPQDKLCTFDLKAEVRRICPCRNPSR